MTHTVLSCSSPVYVFSPLKTYLIKIQDAHNIVFPQGKILIGCKIRLTSTLIILVNISGILVFGSVKALLLFSHA